MPLGMLRGHSVHRRVRVQHRQGGECGDNVIAFVQEELSGNGQMQGMCCGWRCIPPAMTLKSLPRIISSASSCLSPR